MATKKWVCPVCGYVHEGDTPPERCPQCKVPGEKFKLVEENAFQIMKTGDLSCKVSRTILQVNALK